MTVYRNVSCMHARRTCTNTERDDDDNDDNNKNNSDDDDA